MTTRTVRFAAAEPAPRPARTWTMAELARIRNLSDLVKYHTPAADDPWNIPVASFSSGI